MRLPWRRRERPVITPAALAIAEQWALRDRAALARLRALGRVQLGRDLVGAGQREQAKPFIADIEARVSPRRKVNHAVRRRAKKR